MLAPSLVERHPDGDRGVILEGVDHAFEFQHELVVLLVGPLGIDGIGLQSRPRRRFPPLT